MDQIRGLDPLKPWSMSIPDSIYVLCFSLILLSVDLGSPHVKNKMSKREFIRNTRNAVIRAGPRPARGKDDDASELLGPKAIKLFRLKLMLLDIYG